MQEEEEEGSEDSEFSDAPAVHVVSQGRALLQAVVLLAKGGMP